MITSSFKNMARSGPENLSIADQVKYDILINLEVLNGCEHTCPGCLVNRKQDINEEKMYARLEELSNDILKYGFNLREFVIGPTDFLNAFNTMDVLNNKTVQSVLRKNKGARIAAPARIDLVSLEKLQEVLDVLDSDAYRDDMVLEFIMPVTDVETIISSEEYKDQIFERLALMEKSKKLIDWSWTLNISDAMANKLNRDKYDRLIASITNRYDTILEMNPGITRASNKQMIKNNIIEWNTLLNNIITEDNKNKTTLSMANLYANSMNFLGITIVYDKDTDKLKTFLNVNLHEQAIVHHELFDVSDMNLLEIMEYKNTLIMKNVNNLIECCEVCQYSVACSNRLIHNAMTIYDFDECILPFDALNLFDTNNYNEVLNHDALLLIS